MDINNREWAILIWLALLSGCVAANSNCRSAFLDVLRSFLSRKIALIIFSTLIWVCGSILVLSSFRVWGYDNLKATVVWTISFAFSEVLNINKIRDDKLYFKNKILSIFGAPIFLTFLVNYFSFSLIVEIFIAPIVMSIVLSQHISKEMKYRKEITNALNVCIAIVALSAVINSAYNVYVNFHQVAKISTILEFLTPILLSTLFIPYLFILHAAFKYESRYVVIRLFVKNKSLHRYALRSAILAFGFNFEQLQRWVFNLGETRPTDRASIDHSIWTIKVAEPGQF